MADTGAHNVFVGGVAVEASVDELSAHFASLSVVPASVRLLENADGTSKGCAIVEFSSAEAYEAGIASIDNTELLGKTMNAREDRGQRSRQRNQPANEDPSLIYVGNLNVETTADDLTSFFVNYGVVNNVSLHRKRRSEQPQGWATVQFNTVEEAAAALTANGSEFQGAVIAVEELKSGPRPKRERKPRVKEDEKAEPPPAGSLHIGNLAWTVSEDDLTTLFAAYGTVDSVEIARHRHTDKSRGWGSVKMSTADEAAAALSGINLMMFHERELDVQVKSKVSGGPRARKPRNAGADGEEGEGGRRRKRRPRNTGNEEDGDEEQEYVPKVRKPRKRKPKERKEPEPVAVPNPECFLFVGNLAWDATEDGVAQVFASAGSVVRATITMTKRSKEDRSRGWGTVEMGSGAEAESAVATLNGFSFMERELLVRADTRVCQA